ncbi:hypothetical protein AAF712_013533 [Marasmius tenuissimus]|uniref:Uncharacterized protein n=1 Tax=Marasmius tenuissimus TaxID=585030 RepID=A0ABR2ZDE8_9AGAR
MPTGPEPRGLDGSQGPQVYPKTLAIGTDYETLGDSIKNLELKLARHEQHHGATKPRPMIPPTDTAHDLSMANGFHRPPAEDDLERQYLTEEAFPHLRSIQLAGRSLASNAKIVRPEALLSQVKVPSFMASLSPCSWPKQQVHVTPEHATEVPYQIRSLQAKFAVSLLSELFLRRIRDSFTIKKSDKQVLEDRLQEKEELIQRLSSHHQRTQLERDHAIAQRQCDLSEYASSAQFRYNALLNMYEELQRQYNLLVAQTSGGFSKPSI